MLLSSFVRRGLGALAAVGMTVAAHAGSLAPPGAPAPTMKALDVVEPRIPIGPLTTPGTAMSVHQISQPGSYYLTGNLVGEAGKRGIEIVSSGVSLDLSGFTVEGVPGSLEGVRATVLLTNAIRISNGVVRGWGGNGVNTAPASQVVISGVVSILNGDNGIVTGADSVIVDCAARSNGARGFIASVYNTIRSCTAVGNGEAGVTVDYGSAVYDSQAASNGGHGFVLGYWSAITGCVSTENTLDGVNASGRVTIRDNTVSGNFGDGVEVSFDSLVTGNKIDGAGNGAGPSGAGIRVLSDDNHLDANAVTGCDVGIQVDATGNLITRNSVAGNGTSFIIIAGNKVGVIVTPGDSGAINGSGGAAGVGVGNDMNRDPWANIAY
jgi:hypothetical protein